MHILIVEDELKIRDVMKAYFQLEGWTTACTGNGDEALSMFYAGGFDLVILDLMIDGLQGEALCRRIREHSAVPLIMVTSKSREQDVIEGLHLGADHYVVKPFRVKELVAQIHALLRRARSAQESEASARQRRSFNKGDLVFDAGKHEVLLNRRQIHLTTTEFRTLSELIHKSGKLVTREELSEAVLGYRFLNDGRAIDVHIKNLRKKIEKDPKNPVYIVTQIGAGYKFGVKPDEVQP